MTLAVDFAAGHIESLRVEGKERVVESTPLFLIRLRDKEGTTVMCDTYEAAVREEAENGGSYKNFPIDGLSVRIFLTEKGIFKIFFSFFIFIINRNSKTFFSEFYKVLIIS